MMTIDVQESKAHHVTTFQVLLCPVQEETTLHCKLHSQGQCKEGREVHFSFCCENFRVPYNSVEIQSRTDPIIQYDKDNL